MVERARWGILLLALVIVSLSSQSVAAAARTGETDRAEESGTLPNKGWPLMLDDQPQAIYRHAAQAIAGQDVRKADFWLARYMGAATRGTDWGRGYRDLIPLFDQRKDLKPTAFISGHYSDDFLDFFIRGTWEFWAVPDDRVSEADATFVVRPSSHGRYVAEVVVSPVLEGWMISREPISRAVIPLVSGKPPAVLVAGIRREDGSVQSFPRMALNADGNSLQYIWPLEWHDVDGDGIPEVWARYNQAWGDGFSQVLQIYKIVDDKALVLFKHFEGSAEGLAWRLEDGTIEVAEGFTDQALTGHMGFDQHHIETFAFQQGEFVRVAERNVPHLLWGDAWEDPYFGNGPRD